MRHHLLYGLAAAAGSLLFGACDDAPVAGATFAGPVCRVLDFDKDGAGAPIAPGQVVEGAYSSIGVDIDVRTQSNGRKAGLGVAFDAAHPTGNDGDLGFPGLGNVLVNQDRFSASDVARGKVKTPDASSCGARFELDFETPVCLTGFTILDIDSNESAVVDLFDAAGNRVVHQKIASTGNHRKVDVVVKPQGECTTVKAVIAMTGSGAIDNVTYCAADVPEPDPVRWTRTFDAGGDEVASAVDVDGRGRVVIGGYHDPGGDADGLVAVYDAAGTLVWSKLEDGGDADAVEGVAASAAGDVVAVGAVGDGGAQDVWVRAYDPAGTPRWTRTLDGGDVDTALDVDLGSDGAVAVTGALFTGAASDLFVRVYDRNGTELWTRKVDQGTADVGRGIAVGADGRVAVAGQVGGDAPDGFLRLYDRNGTELWTRTVTTGQVNIAHGVAIDASGNVALAGFFTGKTADAFVQSYDPSGTLRWTRTFDSGADDVARGVAVDRAGNVIANGFAGDAVDMWTRKYSATGAELATQMFSAGDAEIGTGVATGPDDAIAVSGFVSGASNLDAFVRVYRP